MDFVSGLSRSLKRHNTVWVVVDRLKKSAYFFPICLPNFVEEFGVIYVHEIVRFHKVLVSIVFYRDPYFTMLF